MMSKLIGYVEGADVYLIISLIIFMLVFLVAAVQMFTMSKQTSDRMSMLPFNQTNNESNEK